MAKIMFDKTGERRYETGVKNCVLYRQDSGVYTKGVAWNGIVSISESPTGGEANAHYADDIKYLNIMSAEELGVTIEAFTYPREFEKCDGTMEVAPGVNTGQQTRSVFALCYKTTIGNDTDGTDHGYKLHLLYGAQASPSEKAYATVSDTTEPITFSWEVTTTPVVIEKLVDGKKLKPTAKLTIDSTTADSTKLAALEEMIYGKDPTTPGGDDGVDPKIPTPDEVITMMGTVIRVG